MSELTEILPLSRLVTLAGIEREVKPINFNTLALIEDKFGGVAALDLSRISSQRFLVWAILHASDKSLTEEAVGEMLTVENGAETSEFILGIFRLSGLLGDEKQPEPGKKRPAKA